MKDRSKDACLEPYIGGVPRPLRPAPERAGRNRPRGPMPLSVDTAAATRQTLANYVTLDGQIAPLNQSSLAFQQSGTITRINVNIGDMVRKGQLLATIDPSTLQAQLSQAQAQAAQASASAQGAVVGYPVQTQTNQADGANGQGFTAERQARLRSEYAALQTGLRFPDPAQQSQSNYVQAQQTYKNAVGRPAQQRGELSEREIPRGLGGRCIGAGPRAGHELSQTYLYRRTMRWSLTGCSTRVRTPRPRSRYSRSPASTGLDQRQRTRRISLLRRPGGVGRSPRRRSRATLQRADSNGQCGPDFWNAFVLRAHRTDTIPATRCAAACWSR